MGNVAVIDIGKTNKKVAVFDAALQQIAYRECAFAARAGDDGIMHEPVAAMWDWFKQQLRELHAEQPFAAIAVTTHGATVACLDADGELALPVVAYDNDLAEAEQAGLDQRFYALVDDPLALQNETATCDMPLLVNPGKAILYYRDHYAAGMQRCRHIVNYPQYWGYRLTGQLGAEPTYTANHSYLFAIRERRPSSIAHKLGVADLIDCDLSRPWDALGTLTPELQAELGLPAIPVALGIHDSNAALLPYLIKHGERDFVVNSTGTWCVAMHGVDRVAYAPEELGRKIIFNIDALDGFQKTSFLMGGQEYACYHDLIGGDHIRFDAAATDEILARPGDMVLPGAFPSQFPKVAGGVLDSGAEIPLAELRAGRKPAWFADQRRAHMRINVSLALQSRVALERTGMGPETTVFIEGGFRQNETYRHVLADLFPHTTVACTNLEQATATGAAVLAQALAEQGHPRDFADRLTIDESPVTPPRLRNLDAYAEAFYARVL